MTRNFILILLLTVFSAVILLALKDSDKLVNAQIISSNSNKKPISHKPTPYPSITPCPNGSGPVLVGNAPANYDPCNPPKPTPLSAEELARREKQKLEWEENEKKLLAANYPLKNETTFDVDEDGKKDKILYRVQPWEKDFEGLLQITNAKGNVIWEHEFFMAKRDLVKFLTEVLEYDSITKWVDSVFNEKNNYSFRVERIKIKESDISSEQLNHAAKIFKFSADKVKSEILAQRTNKVFTYRAEWREDLMQIVYVSSIKRFVCFSRGY
jgi:hypothetical protein